MPVKYCSRCFAPGIEEYQGCPECDYISLGKQLDREVLGITKLATARAYHVADAQDRYYQMVGRGAKVGLQALHYLKLVIGWLNHLADRKPTRKVKSRDEKMNDRIQRRLKERREQ